MNDCDWIVEDVNSYGTRKHVFDKCEEACYFIKMSIISASNGTEPKDMPVFKIYMAYPKEEAKETP